MIDYTHLRHQRHRKLLLLTARNVPSFLQFCRMFTEFFHWYTQKWGGSVAEWLACWTLAQKGCFEPFLYMPMRCQLLLPAIDDNFVKWCVEVFLQSIKCMLYHLDATLARLSWLSNVIRANWYLVSTSSVCMSGRICGTAAWVINCMLFIPLLVLLHTVNSKTLFHLWHSTSDESATVSPRRTGEAAAHWRQATALPALSQSANSFPPVSRRRDAG